MPVTTLPPPRVHFSIPTYLGTFLKLLGTWVHVGTGVLPSTHICTYMYLGKYLAHLMAKGKLRRRNVIIVLKFMVLMV